MYDLRTAQIFRWMVMALVVLLPMSAQSDDIDIFMGVTGNAAQRPNVLIVLDNTSNWSRQSQHWEACENPALEPGDPGCQIIEQGQSEVRAIQRALQDPSITDQLNLGIFEFVAKGTANEDGGYVRHHIQQLTDANKVVVNDKLDTIFNDINGPYEKRNSNTAYGNLFYDIHNYLTGGSSLFPAAVQNNETSGGVTYPDSAGYTTNYSNYLAPLDASNSCSNTVIIFIGNSDSNGPEVDSAANTSALASLGGNTTQLQVPEFEVIVNTDPAVLGFDSSCSSNANQCDPVDDFSAQCPVDGEVPTDGQYDSCYCNAAVFETSGCSGNKKRFQVEGVFEQFVVEPTGRLVPPPSSPVNADEWARFLNQVGMTLPDGSIRYASVHTIDVFNDAQNADQTALLMSMANVGGGEYYAARSEDAVLDAILDIINKIQAVNSTFASASLPVNATNRAQNENQVFIGMFRPDPDAKPRWFGNLKRYQLISDDQGVDLGDVNGDRAISIQTGFVLECATSFWSTGVSNYWENLAISPSPQSFCPAAQAGGTAFSNVPDGPKVEKGATAEVIRRGNDPASEGAAGYPTFAVNRNVLTAVASPTANSDLITFNAANTGLSQDIVDFTLGKDTQNELNLAAADTTKTRPSLHGDVIHSRPLPVTYDSPIGVVVYYGANDGTLRAVEANTGKELWAFIPPEFYSTLERIKDNSIEVAYPGHTGGGEEPKDYHFDGSLGVYQPAGDSTIWIYPSMRRGGRMVYGLDVSDVNLNAPKFKWKAGCPNLDDDVGCTAGMSGIGQTWSKPSVAFIKGYSLTTPVVIFGGGYDDCQDEDAANPTGCGSTKGNAVYVLDADTGALIASFATDSAVAADIALIDANLDTFVDYAYAADLDGNVYRIEFAEQALSHGPRAVADWQSLKIAATSTAGHKFHYGPALLQATSHIVYLALGTGDREHPLHSQYPLQNPVTNRFYVFKDDLSTNTLLDLNDTSVMSDFTTDPGCNGDEVLPTSAKKGWFMDLTGDGTGAGEQTVTSAVIAGGLVIFNTNRAIEPAAGSCSTNLGQARGYTVNLLNSSGAIAVAGACGGDRSSIYVGAGLPPSPVLATVPINGVLTTVIIGAPQRDGGTSTPIGVGKIRPNITSPRQPVYWYKSSGIE